MHCFSHGVYFSSSREFVFQKGFSTAKRFPHCCLPLSDRSPQTAMATAATYKIRIMKEDFKFNASHFVAYEGFREKLHGHNYQVGLQLWARQIASDGYVVDFGDIKQVIRSECKRLHEHFLSPANSNVLTFTKPDQQLCIECEDGSRFSFPRADCVELPIVHTTVEELAEYFFGQIHEALGDTFAARGVYKLEVIVSEAPGQEASFIQEF